MKPLEEHTTAELTDLLHEHCAAWSASWFVPEVVAEIQRRERERCAVECEAEQLGWDKDGAYHQQCLSCADRIRELK